MTIDTVFNFAFIPVEIFLCVLFALDDLWWEEHKYETEKVPLIWQALILSTMLLCFFDAFASIASDIASTIGAHTASFDIDFFLTLFTCICIYGLSVSHNFRRQFQEECSDYSPSLKRRGFYGLDTESV